MVLSEEQTTEQLRGLVASLGIEVPEDWDPLNNEAHDKYIQEWVKHPQNTWCSGRKHDFDVLTQDDYAPGQYAWVVATILGIRVRGRE